MPWDQSLFNEIARRRSDTLAQNANTAAQDVAQKPLIQQAADDAAQRRAQLAADTSLQTTGMNNQNALAVTGAQGQNALATTDLQNVGANYRANLGANTQTNIAGMEDATRRSQLAQQGLQFGQALGLDTAKAQESAIQGRATLGVPEQGPPVLNSKTGQMEQWTKRPAITGLAPSPLNSLGGNASSPLGTETDDSLRKLREQLSQGNQ